jgi:chitodextrinase
VTFFENAASDYDYLRQSSIPAGFGEGEFTVEVWLRPDATLPVGSTASGQQQRRNWSDANPAPYSSSSWWYAGNFLLDGHNNTTYSSGTFSLQFFNGGRVRWLFGDGAPAAQRNGGLHAIQNANSPSLLDGAWHQLTLVRRANGNGATLEMWIDGALTASENTSALTDMRAWWNSWSGFPQAGWIWGAEKQAALGVISQYEDYKGNVDELRFWSIAKTPAEISQNYRLPVTGAENGLVGHFSFEGQSACNQVGSTACMSASRLQSGAWSGPQAPLAGSGDTQPPTVPSDVQASAVGPTRVDLTWRQSADNVAVTAYVIFRNGTLLQTTGNTSFSDTTVSGGAAYSYAVAARDAAGNQSSTSAAVNVQTPTDPSPSDTQPPSVPSELRVTTVTTTEVTLTWQAATDNVGVSGYEVLRNGALAGQSTSTTFTDTGLAPNTSYTYEVRAADSAGNRSLNSPAVQATTSASPPPPSPPPTSPPPSGGGGGGGGQLGLELLFGLMLSLVRRRRDSVGHRA